MKSIVYGPCFSRRYGNVLALNLFPGDKICSFDCVYCQCGPTEIKASEREDVKVYPKLKDIEKELKKYFKSHRNITFDIFMISGNGEPTLYPEFPAIVDVVLEMREKYFKGKGVGVLTNSSSLDETTIGAINKVDEKVFKLDAGNQKTFEKVNRPCGRVLLNKTIAALSYLKDIKLKTVVIEDNIDSLYAYEFGDFLSKIKPSELQLYEVDRPVPGKTESMRIGEKKLTDLAHHISTTTNIKVEVLFNKTSRGLHDLVKE